ncbi:hypothetical protein LINPERPRIM_LOCUS2241 [Linum perenne]
MNWLKLGDRNTKFFHASTVQRRKQNTIIRLKDSEQNWVDETPII